MTMCGRILNEQEKEINGTEINSFPFIDFVALQSHVHSLSYFSPFCGLLMGSPVNTRAPQRQEGPGLLPREGANCSPGEWVCWPQACHPAFARGRRRVCGTTGSCTSPDFAAAATLPHYLLPSPRPACFCPSPQAPGGPGALLPALTWSSLYSLATLPLLHVGSLHKAYSGSFKFFSFLLTSRSIVFLGDLGKSRPC